MRSRLLRSAGVLGAVATMVSTALVGLAGGPSGAAPPDPLCPEPPGCVFTIKDMRCHEREWCKIPVFVTSPRKRDVTVEVETIEGSATAADYRLLTQVVTIPRGARSADIVLWIEPDQEEEGKEEMTVKISKPSDGSAVGNDVTQVAIYG